MLFIVYLTGLSPNTPCNQLVSDTDFVSPNTFAVYREVMIMKNNYDRELADRERLIHRDRDMHRIEELLKSRRHR